MQLRRSSRFEATRAAPREARRFAGRAAAEWGVSADSLGVVVSELAANAVLHAGCEFTLSLTLEDLRLLVEVADSSAQVPVRREPGPDSVTGRGLPLVDALASDWGVRVRPGEGKIVWAEVSLQVEPGQRLNT
jgi:anti-sigma regulatory factor (Ser/Thr protein kinase)